MPPGENHDIVKKYGDISLSAALISILITAPVGAVLSHYLGVVWLD